MIKRLAAAAISAALAVGVFGASGASAATEFGDDCGANTGVPFPFTATVLNSPPAPLPLTAPVGGVITKVKVNLAVAAPFVIPEQVKVLRSAGGTSFTAIAQAEINVTQGTTVTAVRLPVQAGDRLGVRGLPFTFSGESSPGIILLCASETENIVGVSESEMAPGQTGEFDELANARLPLSASIEPDADNDGYGDETQDLCPQSPAFQVACPPVALSTSKQVRKGSVTVIVTTSTPAPVTVNGIVKLGKGKKATLRGGTKSITPGVLGKFTLKLSKKVKKKLKELPRKRKLPLKVTVTGTSVAGAVTTKTLKVKLKGQAKD